MRFPFSSTHCIPRTLFSTLLLLEIAFGGLFPEQLAWASGPEKTASEPTLTAATVSLPSRQSKADFPVQWVEFAHGISEITAAAVSPLLVVSVIGANRYLRANESERGQLPFFCNPLLWSTGLALLAICFLKDALGPALPPLLKKPLDLLELFENKFSALVASTLFVPVITWQMLQHFDHVTALPAVPDGLHLASVWPASLPTLDLRWVLGPACLLSFFTVWLTAHVINVLVAICPIGFIDAFLKLFKNGVLGILMISSAVHPFLGAMVAGCLILFAFAVAGAACRFSVFGTVVALDALVMWRTSDKPLSGPASVFMAESLAGVPARTLGHLVLEKDGSYVFAYRAWFVLPTRRVRLPLGTPLLHRDVLTISLVVRSDSGQERRLVEFPPRYRRHWETLASSYSVSETRDGRLAGGLIAAREWLWQLFGLRTRPPSAAADSWGV